MHVHCPSHILIEFTPTIHTLINIAIGTSPHYHILESMFAFVYRWWKEKRRKKSEPDKETVTYQAYSHPNPKNTLPQQLTSGRGFRSHLSKGRVSTTETNNDNIIAQNDPLLSCQLVSNDSSIVAEDSKQELDTVSTTQQLDTHTMSSDHVSINSKDKQKRRYILFLGNLSTTCTQEDILSHFKKKGVLIKELRLLTHKDTGKSRGCAFAEFATDRAMNNALKFHRSRLSGRTINIEVTCGGGGKGADRKAKIVSKNKRQRVIRARKSGSGGTQ